MKYLMASLLTAGLVGLVGPAAVQAQQYTMPGRTLIPQSNLYNPWNTYHTPYYSHFEPMAGFSQRIPSQSPPWVSPFNPQGMAHGVYDQQFEPTPRFYRPPLNVPYSPPLPLNNPWPSGW